MDIEQGKEYLVRRIRPNEKYESLIRFPSYIEIETVNACNARCPMCTIDDWQRNTPTMKDDLFEKIAAEICDHADHVIRVSVYRDGEPLLDKKLAKRVARLKDGGIKNVAISTNVSLLTEKKSIELLEAGLDTIILSIDSLKKEVYERIRARLVLEEVLENALRFIQLRNEIRPQTTVWIRMIRQEGNYDEWPSFEAYWKSKLSNHDRVNFKNIHNWGSQLEGFNPIADSSESALPCVALWSLMDIFANGDVPLCNADYNNKYPTGSLLDHSIEELWTSRLSNQRREAHLKGNKGCISLCEKCNIWDEPPDRESVSDDYAEKTAVSF